MDNSPSTATESVGTVIVAGAANLAIAIAKLVAGVIAGSASMLSEAAHSFSDTSTEVFLYIALKRGEKPADKKHSFGYGRAAYIWALLAAASTFVIGAGFSITHGIHTIRNGEELGNPTLSFIILAVSFGLETVSLLKGVRQVRGGADRWDITPTRYLRLSPDTTLKAVVLEDSAALIGLVLAALGLGLATWTREPLWDGLASVLIGLLLFVVASVLIRSNASLLIGRSVPGPLEAMIEGELSALPHVEGVRTLFTQQLGIRDVLVAAKIDFADGATGAEIEDTCAQGEQRLHELFPAIRHVFLDPTGTRVDE